MPIFAVLYREEVRGFTLADYEVAKAKMGMQEEKFESYTGNNPEKWRSAREACRARVVLIQSQLKRMGVLPSGNHEQIEMVLHQEFPNAKSGQIIEFEGQRYQRILIPEAESRSGTESHSLD